MKTAQEIRDFVLAGKAIFSVRVPDSDVARLRAAGQDASPHYTFKVRHKAADGRFGDAFFVSLLTGPDNTASYSYLGMLDPATGALRLTGRSSARDDAVSVRLFRFVLSNGVFASGSVPDGFTVHHEGRCGRCGRLLTTPESVERGIGPECWKRSGT